MNSKLWIQKALSMCLVVAMIATYSMVALASSEKVAGELIVNGDAVVTVNGESAKTGRSVFSSSTIATPDNTSAIINMGRAGKIELAANTTLTVNFNENGIRGNLMSGKVTVLGASNTVGITTADGKTVELGAGESASTGKADDDDTKASDGGHGMWAWALILGGAAAGIIWVATNNDSKLALGGGTTVVSPNR